MSRRHAAVIRVDSALHHRLHVVEFDSGLRITGGRRVNSTQQVPRTAAVTEIELAG